MAHPAMSIDEGLAAIKMEVDRLANEEMAAPDFKFKYIGERIGGYGSEISHFPCDLQQSLKELSSIYQGHLGMMKDDCYMLKKIILDLENLKHVLSEIEASPPSGMCVGVHHGAVDRVKSALKDVKGKVRYYKRFRPHYGDEEKGIWHVAMDQETATKCKLFGWLDGFFELHHLSQMSWSEYSDPKKFVRK